MNNFGMKDPDILKLNDKIEIHKNLRINPPKIYAFGMNPTK